MIYFNYIKIKFLESREFNDKVSLAENINLIKS